MCYLVKAVVYTRVSEDRSGVGRSVTEQEAECRAECARRGWEVVEHFPDTDRSASRYARRAREGFQACCDYLATHPVDALVTWEASRSTRDLAVYVQLRDLCRRRGILWSYSGRLYDLNDAGDQFATGLDALLSEQESARTQKRVSRAMRANAAAGRPHGRHLFGYRRIYDPATGRLLSVELNESEAAVVRETARRVLEGESMASVLRDLNSRGVRSLTGGPINPDGMQHFLTNPAYAGKRVHQGNVVGEAIWPAIHDETTWWRLQALLADPRRRNNRTGHDVKHLLSGIAKCGICGSPMYVWLNRGRLTYECRAAMHLARKAAPVDQMVLDVLRDGLSQPGHRHVLVAGEPSTGADGPWAAAAATRARLETFYDSAAAGEITAAALARIEQKLLAEIASLEVAARRAAQPPELRALGETFDFDAEWDGLPILTKRAIVRHYLEVAILPVGKGKRVFDPAAVRITWR